MISRVLRSLENRTRLALALVAGLCLQGCIDGEQDIWLGEDGGGRVKLKVGISKQMLQMMSGLGEGADDPFEIDKARRALAEDSNVNSFEISEDEDENFKYMIADVELADITRLNEMQASVMSDGPAGGAGGEGGELKITRNESGTYTLAGEIAAPEQGEDLGPMAGMLKGMVGDAAVTVRVHAEPVSDDAHNGELDEDGSIVWNLPLSEMLAGKGMTIEGEFNPSGGTGAAGGGAVFWVVLTTVVLVAAALFFVFRAQRPKLA